MDQCYRTTASSSTPGLSDDHRRTLIEGSGIAEDVIAERGVRTVSLGRELPKPYSWRQRRRAPGIQFTVHRPNGETCTLFRPDAPDPKDPGYKYCQPPKSRGGPGNVLDVHPRMRPLLDDLSEPLVFVEGVKKADALASRGVVAVAISGVYNWLSGGEPIDDMYDVPVDGRRVFVCFDSDMLRNPNVQDAAERLAEHLIGRGADAWIVYLPDQPDGSKTGADDFLVAGGTAAELLDLARPFDPEDLKREKLSRSERLRRYLEDLRRQHDEMPAKSQGECSERAAWRACVAQAERRGELVEDGVEVRISARTGGELAAMGRMTFARRMTALSEAGRVRRVKGERSEHADSYVLLATPRALVGHDGEGQRRRGGRPHDDNESHRGVPLARASGNPHCNADCGESQRGMSVARAPAKLPELRWPYVATVREKDERGRLREVYEYVARLGKKRGEIVRHLFEGGGSSTVPELMERFAGPKTRPRDFKRRQLADLLGYRRQHRGTQLSVGPPVIELDGDAVRLVPDWSDALERHRELGGEQDAAVRQKADHLRQSAAYRARNATQADRAPTEKEMAEGREERHKRLEVDRLVAQGMARSFATAAVFKGAAPGPPADGYVEDLRPAEPEPEPPPRRVARPPKVGGVFVHGPACGCEWCADALAPRYATPFGGAL
jgi:hypothetical protein